MNIRPRHTAPFAVSVDMQVYLEPTGNNTHYWDRNPVVGRIVAVKRKYFHVVIELGNGYRSLPVRFSLEDFACADCDNNGGYLAYPSMEVFREAQEVFRMRKELRWAWSSYGVAECLSFTAVKQIYEIMATEGVFPSNQKEE